MNKATIKTIFMGTPDFGIPSLRALIKDDFFDVAAVITQPDKKAGRKQVLSPPPIKQEAEKNNIIVYQPRQISNFQFPISQFQLIVVAAYAQILPKKILDAPEYGCINIHGSLLPYCRGSACIQAPIIRGDKKTGVTIMKMDAGLDTGPILARKAILIEINDTAGSMFDKLSILGAELLVPTLKDYIAGKIKPQAQDESKKTCVNKLKKQDGLINWSKPAEEIERFIRAMTPWPGARCACRFAAFSCQFDNLKILKTEHEPLSINDYQHGEIFIQEKKLAVQCGRDALIILKIQPESKKIMTGDEFINGYIKNL